MAFCFDEAAEFIISHKKIRQTKKDGKIYDEEYWTKKPKWNDVPQEQEEDFIIRMQKNLDKQNKLLGK